MRLKSLTLHGFKSFADRTELEFDSAVTMVVGPNGCGKSNIVDAVKWVLGEQSAKSLRGQQMADVVFNGSSSRKSMGMAEVCLAFETNGQFGDYGPEVVVTRRLYRSGQSEYLVNNKPCRLRDIRDLFLDTGIGVDAYSLIEQCKVDLLLQASNQDRRAVLEEAAGISKYKVRRKEAQRRLENVQQNLLRVGDVIGEVEKHLRSVKYQAGKARSYQQYAARLKELKSQYYLSEYHSLIERQGQLRVEHDEGQEKLRQMQSDHELLEARAAHVDLEMMDLSNRINEIENQLTQTCGQIDSGRQTTTLLAQRMTEQNENLGAARERLHTYYLQMDRLQVEQRQVEGQLEQLNDQQRCLQDQIAQLQDQIRVRDLKIAELTHKLETEKSNLIELLRQTAQLNNQLNQLDLEQQTVTSQKDRLAARKEHLADERRKIMSERVDQQRALVQIDRQIDAVNAELTRLEDRRAKLLRSADELSKALAESKERRSALSSRYEVLADMQAQMQGVGRGAKDLLKLKEQGDPVASGLVGLVADVIRADFDHAKLIEAALMGKDRYLIIEGAEFVERNRALLARLSGPVDVFALDLLGPIVNVRDWSNVEGVLGVAADLVRTEEPCEHLVRVLLGKTLVVRELDTALRLREQNTVGWRFVTTQGEVVETDGSIHVGVTKSGSGLISRKSELALLQRQLSELDEEIHELEQRIEQINDQQDRMSERLSELRSSHYELKTRRIEGHTGLVAIDDQWTKVAQEQPIVETEIESLEKQLRLNADRQGEVRRQLNEVEAAQNTLQRQIAELQQLCESEQRAREDQADQLTELRVEAGGLSQKRQGLIDRINALQSDYHQALGAYRSAQEEIRTGKERLDQVERQILQTESRLAQLYLDKEHYQAQSAQLRQQRQTKSDELQELERQGQQFKGQIAEEQQHVQELALKINALTVRQETLIQRVQEELQVDIETAYGDYQPAEQDWQSLEAEINEFKDKISRLGNVNLDAIAEQEQLEARLVFLTGQSKDLDEAQRKLEDLIAQLDEESRKRFTETFETVRANFQELFRKLFGGGKADLVLDNPDDVLESGIDILARPTGKEPRSVSLLSGGEKTLTTVALLLAIFKSKPSPFCILDEVDAALDEANIDRFNQVLQEFLEHSQFVIITHNRRTMSYADVLYGITMQEAGVSKKVAVRFGKEESPEEEGSEAA